MANHLSAVFFSDKKNTQFFILVACFHSNNSRNLSLPKDSCPVPLCSVFLGVICICQVWGRATQCSLTHRYRQSCLKPVNFLSTCPPLLASQRRLIPQVYIKRYACGIRRLCVATHHWRAWGPWPHPLHMTDRSSVQAFLSNLLPCSSRSNQSLVTV